MKNILWLTEWFPSSFEPYVGDGIERRGKAASLYNNIHVVFVRKKPGLPFGRTEKEEREYSSQYKASIWYYPSIRKFSVWLDILFSNYYFLRLHLKAIREFRKKYGKPHCIQVNVAMKNGIIALLCKRFWGIDYVVVEGWSLFLPESIPSLKSKGELFSYFTRRVYEKASQVITISDHLGKMIRAHIADVPYKIIPSVVDTTIFYPAQHAVKNEVFRFIHISNLDYSKNIYQLLLGFKQTLDAGYRAELIMHSPARRDLLTTIADLQLDQHVIIKDECPQEGLADTIRSSDALVLFSLYETFGNVVIEVQACGIPVITSNYPTFFETVEDNVNGIIAKGTDANALTEAMIKMITSKEQFNGQKIAAKAAQTYSFHQIGRMLDEVYVNLEHGNRTTH
jgi:glycosyltransferase involved in cell wall biosynthesis